MTTVNTSIKDLLKGDKVLFYGHIFNVTGNPVKHDDRDKLAYYTVKCTISEKSKGLAISSLLNDYDYFQGIKSVTFSKIKK
mgnify:CR=1 FL=1